MTEAMEIAKGGSASSFTPSIRLDSSVPEHLCDPICQRGGRVEIEVCDIGHHIADSLFNRYLTEDFMKLREDRNIDPLVLDLQSPCNLMRTYFEEPFFEGD